jgi:radical SAM protein with 4Fe4S-binding SPASM domain
MSYNRFFVEGFTGCVVMDFNRMTFVRYADKNVADLKDIKPIMECKFEDYLYPAWISNAIIRIGENRENLLNLKHILQSLQHLLCKHIVVDFNYKSTMSDLALFLETLNGYNIHEAMILLNYCDEFYSDDFADLILSTNRFSSMVIFESPFDKNLENTIHYFQQPRNFPNYLKNKREFGCTPMTFVESKKHHTYFHRKMFIDQDGQIRNAPETAEEFGNIHDYDSQEQLMELVQSPEFQKYWHIKKEDCAVCKDCEYRFMCIDNRVPVSFGDGKWSHTIECNYHPYLGTWL